MATQNMKVPQNDGESRAGLNRLITGVFADGDYILKLYGDAITEAIPGVSFENVPFIRFSLTSTPAHTEGQLHWNNTDKTLELDLDIPDVHQQIGQEVFIRATNKEGSTVTNGQVVRLKGAVGDRPTFELAQADSIANANVMGVATHDIANNATGFITVLGLVRDLNTSAFNEGDIVYLDAVTPGALTAVAPGVAVQVGTIVRDHPNQGILLVSIFKVS